MQSNVRTLGRTDAIWLAAEWACALAAAALWSAARPPQGVVLLAAPLWAAAWLWRWLRLGQATRPTLLDWPLAAFMLTCLVGLWAAPDRWAALVQLDYYLGAIGLYYLLVNGPTRAREGFGYAVGVFAAMLAVYFASQHDWTSSPAKIAVIGALGQRLNGITPQLGLYQPHPNVVGSLLALLLPAPAMQALAGQRRLAGRVLAGGLALVIVFGLVMTQSRDSALALAGAAGLAVWWRLSQAGPVSQQRRGWVFATGVAGAALLAAIIVAAAPNLVTLALGTLPGPNSTTSRVEVYQQVWRLAQATPFTGGGLAAFPGLYSTYILVIPNLFLTHAHNAYLNVLVEQGWPGLLSYIVVLGAALIGGLGQLQRPDGPGRAIATAGLLGLVVVTLQGLGDGTLVASRVSLALWVPAGLALGGIEVGVAPATAGRPRWAVWAPAGLAGVVLLAAAFSWRGLAAAWYADQGSVGFARAQLAGWPTNVWSEGQEVPQLLPTRPDLERALALEPDNASAHFRLGLLAELQRDYPAAVTELEAARAADEQHRGIRKSLAYAYAWAGDTQHAIPLLKTLPEANSELEIYSWWWGTQGRADLAERARLLAAEVPAP